MAAGALATALLIGGAIAVGRSPDSTAPPRSASDQPPSEAQGEPVDDGPAAEVVNGWPDTTENPAGTYSWDRRTCAGRRSCVLGFMHNGYGSGDVEIIVEAVSEKPPIRKAGETAVTFAGHDGFYRRLDARTEKWTVGIQGMTIAIRFEAKPGASDADLAEARAVIDSMRTEPQDTKLGFRLVFTLPTDDWDSG